MSMQRLPPETVANIFSDSCRSWALKVVEGRSNEKLTEDLYNYARVCRKV